VGQSSSFSSLRSEKGVVGNYLKKIFRREIFSVNRPAVDNARSSDCELSQVRKRFTGKTFWINPDHTAINKANTVRLQKIRNRAVILF
jgi:hypothetical protein